VLVGLYGEFAVFFVDVFDMCFKVEIKVIEYGCFCHGDSGGIGEVDTGGGYPETCGAGYMWFIKCYGCVIMNCEIGDLVLFTGFFEFL